MHLKTKYTVSDSIKTKNYEITYDKSGKIILKKLFKYDILLKDTLVEVVEYKYNSMGYPKQIGNLYFDYYKNGYLKYCYKLNEDDIKQIIYQFKYDKKNNIIRYEYLDKTFNLNNLYKIKLKYKKGKLKKRIVKSGNLKVYENFNSKQELISYTGLIKSDLRQKKYKGYKYDRIFETVETTENRKTIKSIFLFDFYDRISEIFIINLIPNNYTPLVKKERAFPARFYIYYPDGFNTHYIKIFYDISEKFDKGNNKILKIISDKAVFIFNYYENGLMKKISKYYEENNKVFDTEFKYVYYK